jgi:Uma2 family endonuclease
MTEAGMDGGAVSLLERHPWVRRHKLDIADFYRMAEAGFFPDGQRVELIEGEIVDMAPIGSAHAGTVGAIHHAAYTRAGSLATVVAQHPLRLSQDSEPQPDVMLLRPRADFYRGAHPTPADVLLLIEVADSSLRFDTAVKLPLYARHGIPEVWIVNLAARDIAVHRDPAGEAYRTLRVASRGEVLEAAALPGACFDVSEVLG